MSKRWCGIEQVDAGEGGPGDRGGHAIRAGHLWDLCPEGGPSDPQQGGGAPGADQGGHFR